MTPYLSTPSKLGILQSEAGSRAQSDGCYGLTLALIGGVYGETEPEKATQSKAGHNKDPLTSLEPKSRRCIGPASDKSKGF
ncbi:hypothetical protein DP117_31825 [Brasilonema sp. UFV-L1]|nr:hypothetical protein [Brasilonema sp. UFV-L1]